MLALQKKGAITFDYGNNIRTQAKKAGCERAFDIPGFVPEYIRPLFCEGKGPFRSAALSGDSADIARTDQLALELFPKNEILALYLNLAPYGNQTTGIARASHLYFGCGPEELTAAQAAFLAALPQRPGAFATGRRLKA